MQRVSARVNMTTLTMPQRTWEETHQHTPLPAPVVPHVPPAEIELLRAKAVVCDAYRKWLVTTSRWDRLQVNDALIALGEIEDKL